jgi:plasmid maintenance system antidote protein VapI
LRGQVIEHTAAARGITAKRVIRPGEWFGRTAEFWMNHQVAHDLEVARKARRLAA